jgi:pyruvate formate lyase activating enzyme
VTCLTCQKGCVLADGAFGWCHTRVNEGGRLYSLIYGEVAARSVNPIEKTPVYHFYPGSKWLSLGSVGCNFRCPGCQNWQCSHWLHGPMGTQYLSPGESVAVARGWQCAGLSWTFNEPAIWFEYTLEGAKSAKAEGLCTNYVTNGSLSRQAFELIAPYLDVYLVDVKAFSQRTYRALGHLLDYAEILEVAQRAKWQGLHVEVVTNVIPEINDSDEELYAIAGWINDNLGRDTPWHVTKFFPHHRLRHLPSTPIERLESACAIGNDVGLWYVYLGNVAGHPRESTCCHVCKEPLIRRHASDVLENRLIDGRCPACRSEIPGRF